jgi:hypothetical protein
VTEPDELDDPDLADLDPAWRRSKRGNLWRPFDGLTLAVFRRWNRWAWCIADGDHPRFSHRTYGSVADAVAAVEEEVQGDDPCRW